ncbi:MAG: amidohydrolase family protein [Acidobacteria bacterium]|nr:amidohydrolase family protein [Acidobacteriota bacterium]
MSRFTLQCAVLVAATFFLGSEALAQGLSKGPFKRLVIRSATIIDGTGAPPQFPIDIVVEDGRIVEVKLVGDDFGKIDAERRPKAGDFELDAKGLYVMPGFVDAHIHINSEKNAGLPATFSYYLWLAHGITSVLDAGSGNGLEWTVADRDKSARHEIMAPRIFAYVRPGMSFDKAVTTPEIAREWVRAVAKIGADGLKLGAHRPAIMAALIDEAHKQKIGTTAHLGQDGVSRMNIVDAARLGLDSQQHWYGLPEAMLRDHTIPNWRTNHNQNNEQDRFSDAGQFWGQAADPGSPRWEAVMDELLKLKLIMVPTTVAYEFLRDLMRVKQAEWHDVYSSPGMLSHWIPNPGNHGSLYFFWRTFDEAGWANNFTKWHRFLNEFKNRGGRVAAGSDSGTAYNLYGFGYIRELELLQHAGFHPLEVIRAATLMGAETLGTADKMGTIEVGKIADFAITDENPLENLKVLYGTGALRYDPATGKVGRVGGVKWTIKDGIVYDAKGLLKEVARMVDQAKRKVSTNNDSKH